MAKEYERWKIGNIGYIIGPQELKWQQIGNTIGNKRQQPKLGLPFGRAPAARQGSSGVVLSGAAPSSCQGKPMADCKESDKLLEHEKDEIRRRLVMAVSSKRPRGEKRETSKTVCAIMLSYFWAFAWCYEPRRLYLRITLLLPAARMVAAALFPWRLILSPRGGLFAAEIRGPFISPRTMAS